MALGIVSANKCMHTSPSLPQAVKVGFSFCPCPCLEENNGVGGYTFSDRLARMFDKSGVGKPVMRFADWGDSLKLALGTDEKVSSNNNNHNNGSVTIRKNGNGIVAEMTVAAGPERVWRILTSFDEMDAHLSGLTTSKILMKEGNYLLVEQRAKVGIPLFSFTFRVLMDVVEDRPFLYFSQREGSFATFRGHWRVEPTWEGKGTRIRYYLEASPAHNLGGRQFGNRLIKQNLQQLATWIDT